MKGEYLGYFLAKDKQAKNSFVKFMRSKGIKIKTINVYLDKKTLSGYKIYSI